MPQKFIGLEDAAKQLGATKEQLNSLREAGELRGYRDGASWKFRTEEIDALAQSGLPSSEAASDDNLSLDALGEGLSSESLDFSDDLSIDLSDLDLSGELSVADESAPDSDPELLAVDEPTVPADEDVPAEESSAESTPSDTGDDLLVEDVDEEEDDAESILLTDASVGGSSDRPPSTIIGKNELAAGDDDLELAPSGSGGPQSDVKLVADDEDDLVLGDASSGAAAQFEGLEELEIDLEAESSRILEAEDLEAAKAAAEKQKGESSSPANNALDSDFGLAPGSDAASLTGLSQLSGVDDEFELAADSSVGGQASAIGNDNGADEKKGPGSSAVLSDDDDDDFVLGGDSDSDVTHSAADSGINLTPADSGLALDDASLDLSGASGGSSLDLSESFGAALTGAGDDDSSIVSAEVSGSQDFLLQPVADEESDIEEDSSQIIALEEVGEDDDAMLGGEVAFDGAGAADFEAAPASVGAAVEEQQFGGLTISLLACSVAALGFCGLLAVDMVHTMWAWDEPYSINSSILESLAGLMGL
ncbi:MAG: helix-turn-helix domain-containing protein [Planctomycetota bacterium]